MSLLRMFDPDPNGKPRFAKVLARVITFNLDHDLSLTPNKVFLVPKPNQRLTTALSHHKP